MRRVKCHGDSSVAQRLRRNQPSAIVSYVNASGIYADIVGYGDTLPLRVANADGQLPNGQWTRLSVSTPASIYSDIIGRKAPAGSKENWHGMAYQAYERKEVICV